MHSFLKSVGFSKIATAKQEKILLDSILEKPQKKKLINNPLDNDTLYGELSTEYAPGIGVRIIGEYDEYEQFRMDHYYPYVEGHYESIDEECYVGRKMDALSYSGMCEDDRIGVSVIFHVTNTLDCVRRGEPVLGDSRRKIRLSGLCSEGIVLLPTLNTSEVLKGSVRMSERQERIAAARNGSKEAMEQLVIDDIDAFASISTRLMREDVFSIIETSFIPYGMETELYKVLGIIASVDSFINPILKEKLYLIKLLVNDVTIDICINEENLSGEPLPGRRFRGIIWLQGTVSPSE